LSFVAARALIVMATALAITAPALGAGDDAGTAAEDTLPWDKAFVQLGGFVVSTDSGFILGADNIGVGIRLNVEQFLGLDGTNIAFRFDSRYRYSRNLRHKVDFSWFSLNRNGENSIDQQIELPDGGVIEPGTDIRSVFDFEIFKVKYDYSFLLDDRIDLGIGGGLYIMPIRFGLGEKEDPELTQESITAPLPVLSLRFDVAFSPKWSFRNAIDFLYLKISDFEGTIADLNFGLERKVSKHLGLGLGVETLVIGIDSDANDAYPGVDFTGEVGFTYTGVQFYVKGAF
jgi:hypothetical protein